MKTILESTEFGLDMIRGLPQAYYYAQHNIPHKCIVKKGLEPLYKLVSNNIKESAGYATYNPEDLYLYDGPKWSKKEWLPPPLKQWFKNKLGFNKPTVVINNKCAFDANSLKCLEAAKKHNLDTSLGQILVQPREQWVHKGGARSDINCSLHHYSLPMLSKLIELLSDTYQILYISPIPNQSGFLTDISPLPYFGDFDFIEKNYPQVYTIRQFLGKTDLTDNFNIAQFMLMATSDKHITNVGGNAKVSSYFGGDVLIYRSDIWYHSSFKGKRKIWESGSWLKRLSNPPSNIISYNTYNDILNHIENNWINT